MSDAENLAKVLQLLKEVAAEKEKIKQLSDGQKEDVAALSNLLLQEESATRRLIASIEEKMAAARKANDEEKINKLEQEKRLYEFVQRARDAELGRYEEIAKKAKEHNDYKIGSDAAAVKALENNTATSTSAIRSNYKFSADFIEKLQEKQLAQLATGTGAAAAAAKKSGASIQNVFGDAMKGSSAAGRFVGQIGGALLGEVIGMGGDMLEAQADTIGTATKRIIGDLDTQYRNYRKTVGIEIPQSQEAFLAVMDAQADLAIKFNAAQESAGSTLRMIEGISIDPSESAAAMKSLTQGVSVFSKVMKDTPDVGAAMANNAAALSRLGVSQQATATTMEIGSKAMSMQGTELIELTRQVIGTGIAIDKDLNQVMADFNTMAPQLTQFGSDMVKVFSNLEAQSKATGIAAGDLLNTAMKFDTFEGAAQAAGKLNAILGDTVVDTMALVHASPDKKIDILRQSLDDAGKSFETLHRREQQVIASSLGLGSVMEAQKLFNEENADAYTDYASRVAGGIDTDQTQKDIKDLALQTRTIGDILEGTASNMANAMQKASNVMRTSAEALATTMTTVTDGVQKLGGHAGFSQDAVKKTAIENAKAADSMVKDNKRLKASQDELRGAPPIVAKAPSPKEAPNVASPTTIAPKKPAGPSDVSEAQALAFQDRAAILAQAQAGVRNVENAMKMFGDINAPGGQSLEKKATVAVTMLQGEMKEVVKDLSKNLGVSMEKAFAIGMDLKVLDPLMDASANIVENLAKQEKTGLPGDGIPIKRVMEMLSTEKTVPEAIPMVKEFETLKTKTLDSTVHMEKITLLQETQRETSEQFAIGLQELMQFMKENQPAAGTGVDLRNLNIRLGTREFAAVVEDALKNTRL